MKARHVIGFTIAALGAALTAIAGLHMAEIGSAAPGFIGSGYLAGMGFMTFCCGLFVVDGDGTNA